MGKLFENIEGNSFKLSENDDQQGQIEFDITIRHIQMQRRPDGAWIAYADNDEHKAHVGKTWKEALATLVLKTSKITK